MLVYLPVVGSVMLVESLRALSNLRRGHPIPTRRPANHNWIHGLPFNRLLLALLVLAVGIRLVAGLLAPPELFSVTSAEA